MVDPHPPSLFADEPERLRRLVLLLYLVVGPVFTFVLYAISKPDLWWVAPIVGALIIAGLIVLGLRRHPGHLAWTFIGAFVPAVSCGLASLATGAQGAAYLAVLGAPVAWSMVLFDSVVAWWAYGISVAVCAGVISLETSPSVAVGNTAVFATIYWLVTWVGQRKSRYLRYAREAVAVEHARTVALLDAIPDVVVRVDAEGRFLDLHVPAGSSLPLPREQLIGRSAVELVPPSVGAQMRAALARTLLTGEPTHLEYPAPYPDGVRWFHSRFARLGPTEGLVVRQDITAQRRARDELEVYGTLIQHMAEAVIVLSLEGVVEIWSPGAEHLYGIGALEAVGQRVSGLIRSSLNSDLGQLVRRLEQDEQVTLTPTHTRPDGREVVVEASFGLLRTDDDMPRAILVVARDVTAQARAHAEELDLARMQSLGQRMNEVEFVFRADGSVQHVNDRALSTYGYTREEMLRLSITDLRSPETHADIAGQMQGALSEGVRFETVHRKKDGTRFPVEVSSRGFTVNGQTYLHTLVRDLTASHGARAELVEALSRNEALVAELRVATRQAQSANELKGQFLANVSHEIRTPLHAIIGMARLGQDEPSLPRLREYFGLVQRSGSTLLALVNDILDFAKIEAGKLTLERIPFDVHQLVREVVSTFAAPAKERGLTLTVKIEPRVRALVTGDPLRVRQVLTNLVSNALKFTEQGGVEVSLHPEAGELLDLKVRDTGIGMTPAQVQSLFAAFTQADPSTQRRFGGTGLGLAISRDLARAMGGGLVVDSTPGQGSTFTFRVPLPAAPMDGVSAEAAQAQAMLTPPTPPTGFKGLLAGRRVLVAEDNYVNQMLARILLEKVGVEAVIVASGRAAVDAVRTATPPFDVVLMDLKLPDVDGLEATRLIRAAGGADAPPVVALTAHSRDEVALRTQAAGMVDYLAKPLDADALYRVLGRLVARRSAA